MRSKVQIANSHEQNSNIEGMIWNLYGGVIDPLSGDPSSLSSGEASFSRGICPDNWVIPLPSTASSEPDRGNGSLICYSFGYAFIQRNRPFQVSIGSGQEEAELLSLIQEEKKESDRIAEQGFLGDSLRLSSSASPEKFTSDYIMIILELSKSVFLPKALDFFKKVLQAVPVGEIGKRPAYREFDPVLFTLKSQETIWLESGRGLIIVEPKNLKAYQAITFYSLALHHRLEAAEIELDRQRQRSLSYPGHTGKSTVRSLAIQHSLKEETSKIYRQSLILSDLSRRFTDPKSFIPGSSESSDRIYNVFAERYRFGEREESAWDQQEVLQQLFDICCDRVSEFKYFFYEAVFEIVIVVILLIDFLWLIFER